MPVVESSLQDLVEFINETQDARELKRVLAVKMTLQGTLQPDIIALLQVTSGFISKWKSIDQAEGAEGLKLGYKGGLGYLSREQVEAVVTWLQQKDYWQLEELQRHLWETYQVEFRSRQSYYDLMTQAGLSWKKTQTVNPKRDEAKVSAKKSKSSASSSTTVRTWSRTSCGS
jgi:putative transposase